MIVRRLWRARSGATAVEAAFILPILLAIILAAIELSRLAWTQGALNYAVQEAARCAAVRPTVCGADAEIAAFARQRTAPLDIPASAFTISRPACGVRVSGAFTHRFIISKIFPSPPTLRAEVCRP